MQNQPLVEINYKLADGKRIRLEVSVEVQELLEQADRQIRSQRRQEKRRHTAYIDGVTDTTAVFPQEDFADLVSRMDNYGRLYAAIRMLSGTQRHRMLLHYFGGFTYRQIAEFDGVAPMTVVDSIKQARKRLKRLLTH